MAENTDRLNTVTSPDSDQLIRFLLPDTHCRGVIIRAEHIFSAANQIHGLHGSIATSFNQTLLASILLLSISKGGLRQVLQLDAITTSPVRRILSEARQGCVRGYLNWQENHAAMPPHEPGEGLTGWLGSPIRLSTVRDLGVGQPYVSTIEHQSAYLADHLIHYLNQSVQIRADIILHGNLAIMIEAMPGCDDEHWFKAIKTIAAIPDQALATDSADTLLAYFSDLHCKVAGRDDYAYHCDCNVEKMSQAIKNMPAEQLQSLVNEDGKITVSCQYCDVHHIIEPMIFAAEQPCPKPT